MNSQEKPSIPQIFDQILQMTGILPPAIQKSGDARKSMVYEHLHSGGFAMPAENAALDEPTRTLVYLAAILASSNHACIQAMANRAKVQEIPADHLLETLHIARFALGTWVLGDAAPLFDSPRP